MFEGAADAFEGGKEPGSERGSRETSSEIAEDNSSGEDMADMETNDEDAKVHSRDTCQLNCCPCKIRCGSTY